MESENILIVADSERDANMLYAVGMFVPDPFIFLRANGKDHIVMSDLEIDRAKKQAPHCKVLSFSTYQQKLREQGVRSPSYAQIIAELVREKEIEKIFVPGNFPHGLARDLRRFNVKVTVKEGGIFPEREFKNTDEVKKISAALMMAEVGLAEGIQCLKRARIGKDGKLSHNNVPLTAEKVRAVIDIAIIQAGGIAAHTIVACGKQGCDPHERGSGVLKANQPIIIDVFPRSQKTGYFGDITRTVVRGKASDTIKKMYQTVAQGQAIGFKRLRDGVTGSSVHKEILEHFENEGFKTGKVKGRMQGFFHGTGHGLGLEIHEPPRVSPSANDLMRAGHVVTVEPGLYYPNLGGVRLEDVAHITKDGVRNLTKFEKVLEI